MTLFSSSRFFLASLRSLSFFLIRLLASCYTKSKSKSQSDEDPTHRWYFYSNWGLYLRYNEEWYRAKMPTWKHRLEKMSASQGPGNFEAKPRIDTTRELHEEMKSFVQHYGATVKIWSLWENPKVTFSLGHAQERLPCPWVFLCDWQISARTTLLKHREYCAMKILLRANRWT